MRPVERTGDERRLDEALAALRREESDIETPARVEAVLMAAWEASDGPKSTPASSAYVGATFRWPAVVGVRRWRHAAALAAGVALTLGLGRLGQELGEARQMATADEPQTLLLVGQPILDGEAVRVVRMRMPASTLTNLGVRSAAGELADAVDVDVIVGEDGVARAIRF